MCYIDVLRRRINDSVFYLAHTWFQSPIFVLAIRFSQEQPECRLLPVRLLDIDVGNLGPRLGGVRGPGAGGHLSGLLTPGLEPPQVGPVTGAGEYHLGRLHTKTEKMTNAATAIRLGDIKFASSMYRNIYKSFHVMIYS